MIEDEFDAAMRGAIGDRDFSEASLAQLCSVCSGVSSFRAAIVLLARTPPFTQAAMAASDGASLVEELQFTLGEGPGVDAFALGQPVLSENLEQMMPRWTQFVPGATAEGIRAAFAFPLRTSSGPAGVLSLYAPHPTILNAERIADLATLADLVAQTVLEMQVGAKAEELSTTLEGAAEHRSVVHQATGMVTMQIGCSAEDALSRLRARAFRRGVSVDELARQVVMRVVRFNK